nr:MAG TPA: restriction enzyme [Herelleviridae sp.]
MAKRKTQKEFNEEVLNLVGDDYVFLENYINTYTPIKVKHKVCKAEYKVAPRDFLKGLRCPVCSSSRGEKSLVEYFIKKGIKYETQKSYPDLKNERRLYFDFYLPELNTVIEYNGKQHYEPIEFFGGGEDFRKQEKNDRVKKEYARKNSIRYLEIPYTFKTTKHIHELLDDIL